MTVIEDFAAATAQLQFDSLTGAVRDKLKLHVVDVIGAWVAGGATAEGAKLIAFRDQAVGQGGASESLALDIATNCALARLSEVDDIHLASMTTPGSIVVAGALTIARSAANTSTSELLAAVMAGYEAMIRLGLALNGPHNLYRGIWPTYIAAPFGIAAVAARLMGLDAGQTAHALALALTLAAPGVGHHNAATTSRWFAVGNAVRNGLTAAQAAQAGFTSDLKLLESGFFSNVYGITPDMAAFSRGESVLTQLSFKPWCAARQTMAATQALREIVQDGVAPDAMQSIRVAVPPPHLKMIDHGVMAGDRASHLTSVPYQMAVAACRPNEVYDVGQSPGSLPAEVTAFMGRITVEGDDTLLADYPAVWPARVSLTTSAGKVEHTATHVPGDPARPFDAAAVMDKFRRVTAPVLTAERADGLAKRIVDGLNGPKFAFGWREIRGTA
jgi:2-methylcitrate dehydratase PrpD